MRYAKLINAYPTYAPNPILHNGLWYGNPPGSVYEAEGYKPVRFTDQPELLGNGYYVEKWSETSTNIVRDWEWIENNEVDADEAMEILFGGEY